MDERNVSTISTVDTQTAAGGASVTDAAGGAGTTGTTGVPTTSGESTISGESGTAETARAQRMTGEQLFEKYEAGASVDELNAIIASERDVQETPQEAEQERQQPQQPQESRQEPQERNTRRDAPRADSPEAGERRFTQKDVDYLIGKKTSEVTRRHSALLDDLSRLLGVPRDQVTEAVRRQRLEGEAEEKGIEDKELYARNVELEEANRQFVAERESEARRRTLMAEIDRQVEAAKKNIPGFDMAKAVERDGFAGLLGALSRDAQTREHAVEMAYRALFAPEIARSAAEAERERVISSVRSGQMRVGEGAAAGSAAAASRIDVSSLTDEQIADLAARAANGETIIL